MANMIFSGGAHKTLRENFYERVKYKKFIDSLGGKFIDTLYDRKSAFYGVLNSSYEPTIYLGDKKTMKEFSGLNPGLHVINFVHDAFMNFREDYSNLVNRSTIGFPPFLEGLQPVKAHESFEKKYADYIIFTSASYIALLEDEKTLHNFRSFIDFLKKAFIDELRQFPITKSGFALSRFNDVATTGLVIELASMEYDVDTNKGVICQSPEFECYINIANKHGFMVDAHAPWRLYADLENPVMQYLIRNPQLDKGLPESLSKATLGKYDLGVSNDIQVNQVVATRNLATQNFMDSVYRTKTHLDDLYHLQDFVYQIYNQIKKNVPFLANLSYNKKEVVIRATPGFLRPKEWLELLLFVRLLEVGRFTSTAFEKHREEIFLSSRVYGVKQATGRIGHIIATFIKEAYERKDNSNT